MANFSDVCRDAKVSAASCREASKIEALANHEEFYQPSYPVERNDLLKPLKQEINSLSAAALKDVAKVHERIVSKTNSPPTNGGVEIDDNGNITGLTFGTWAAPLTVSYRPNDK